MKKDFLESSFLDSKDFVRDFSQTSLRDSKVDSKNFIESSKDFMRDSKVDSIESNNHHINEKKDSIESKNLNFILETKILETKSPKDSIESKKAKDSKIDSNILSLAHHPTKKIESKPTIFHLCVFVYIILFVFLLNILTERFNEKIFIESLNLDSNLSLYFFIFSLLFCAILCVLSLLDSIFFCSPKILLFALFSSSVAIFYITQDSIITPFATLGIFYFFYFILHLFSDKEMIGNGDIWVLSALSIFLESCFEISLILIAFLIIFASILGIIYAIFLKIFVKKDSKFSRLKVPFVPSLSVSFLFVGHYAI